jgi:hypothetical protein
MTANLTITALLVNGDETVSLLQTVVHAQR